MALSLCHGGVVVKAACGAQSLRSENRFLAWAPSPLNNLKVSWLKSERKGLGKVEKLRSCCGSRTLKGEDRFPPGPRARLRWFQSGRNRIGNSALLSCFQSGRNRRNRLESCNRFEKLNK